MTRLIGRRHEAQPEGIEDAGRGQRDAQRAIEDRPHDQGDDRQPEEQGEQAGQGDDRPVRPSARPGRPAGRSIERALTIARRLRRSRRRQEPEAAQDRLAVGPANQVRKACGGVGVRRGLDDDAGVRRQDVGRVGDVDRSRPWSRPWRRSRRRSPASPSPSSILATTAFDVVLLGHDVGLVGGDEVGRIAGLLGQVRDELVGVLRDRHGRRRRR